MAQYHLSVKIGGPSTKTTNNSSRLTMSATRRSDYVEREGEDAKKQDLLYKEMFLCKNAPQEWNDPEILWGEVERIDKGSDAQQYREFEIALPKELTLEQQKNLAREFAKTLVEDGMCVDMAIHDKKIVNGKSNDNVHVHFVCTMRSVDKDGKFMPKRDRSYETENGNKIPVLDKNGKQKIRNGRKLWKQKDVPTNDWHTKEKLDEWRKRWQDVCNNALERAGSSERIDHRSYKDQGLDIMPMKHEGYAARNREKRGQKSARCEYNRKVRAYNKKVKRANKHLKRLKALRKRLSIQQKEYKKNQHIIKYIYNFYKKEIADIEHKLFAIDLNISNISETARARAEKEVYADDKYRKHFRECEARLKQAQEFYDTFLIKSNFDKAAAYLEKNPNQPGYFSSRRGDWDAAKKVCDDEKILSQRVYNAERDVAKAIESLSFVQKSEIDERAKKYTIEERTASKKALTSTKNMYVKGLDFLSKSFGKSIDLNADLSKADSELAAVTLCKMFSGEGKNELTAVFNIVKKLVPEPAFVKNLKSLVEISNQQLEQRKLQATQQKQQSILPRQPQQSPAPAPQAPGRVRTVEPPPGTAPKPIKLKEFEGMEQNWELMNEIEREAERMREATRF